MVYDANYVAPSSSLRSGRPADNFIPGLGADTIYFGANTNILDYEDAVTGVTVDLVTPSNNLGSFAAGDTYVSPISSVTDILVNISGSAFDDILYGNAGDNVLLGGGFHPSGGGYNDGAQGTTGADYLDGRDGNDTLYGVAGDDILIGGTGNDVLKGDIGGDWLTGGAGSDLFQYSVDTDSPLAHCDVLTDFQTGVDKIDLRMLSGSYGSVAVNWVYVGADTHVYIDLGSNGSNELVLLLAGTTSFAGSDILS